jgi:predicted nucleic acid-binding protein
MADQPYQLAYLDADIWLSALIGEPGRAEIVRPILTAADGGHVKLLVSALMPLEVLGGGNQTRTQEQEQAALSMVTRSSNIVVAAGRALVLRARQYRLTYNLKSMDALHLASAVHGHAEVFFTWNSDDFSRVGPTIDGMRISEPYWYGTPEIEGLILPERKEAPGST